LHALYVSVYAVYQAYFIMSRRVTINDSANRIGAPRRPTQLAFIVISVVVLFLGRKTLFADDQPIATNVRNLHAFAALRDRIVLRDPVGPLMSSTDGSSGDCVAVRLSCATLKPGVLSVEGLLDHCEALDLASCTGTVGALREGRRLKSVRSLVLSGSDVTDDLSSCVGRFDSLIDLDLSHTKVTDKLLNSVCRLKHIRHLALASTSITDAGVACLATIDDLESLDLAATAITWNGIAALGLPSLRRLNVSRCNLGASTATVARALRHLQSLEIDGRELNSQFAHQLANIPSLRQLVIHGDVVHDGVWARLAKCTNITSFAFYGGLNDDNQLLELSAHGRINALEIWSSDVSNEALQTLLKRCPITALALVNTSIDGRAFADPSNISLLRSFRFVGKGTNGLLDRISRARQLEQLVVTAGENDDAAFGGINELAKLKVLMVEHAQLSNVAVDRISKLSELQSLTLAACGLKPGSLRGVSMLLSLERLDVSANDLGMADIDEVAKLPQLHRLYLQNCTLADESMIGLSATKSLRWIDASGTGIGDGGLASLQSLDSLMYVNVAASKVSVVGIRALKRSRPLATIGE
jgi:Leucine-rich repeat (LRR) protein